METQGMITVGTAKKHLTASSRPASGRAPGHALNRLTGAGLAIQAGIGAQSMRRVTEISIETSQLPKSAMADSQMSKKHENLFSLIRGVTATPQGIGITPEMAGPKGTRLGTVAARAIQSGIIIMMTGVIAETLLTANAVGTIKMTDPLLKVHSLLLVLCMTRHQHCLLLKNIEVIANITNYDTPVLLLRVVLLSGFLAHTDRLAITEVAGSEQPVHRLLLIPPGTLY